MDIPKTILSVSDLHISFAGQKDFIAVNDISFHVGEGETLAIVGESGSGKSLTALSLMGLLPKAAKVSGKLTLTTNDRSYTLSDLAPAEWNKIRGKDISMIFQEPMSSLNPIMSVGKQLTEVIVAHRKIAQPEAKQTAISWLQKVQLPDPEKIYDRYPHQLSGGQKQRVMIAMAMCNHPVLLIADEPTTAIDVTVQREIIQLMRFLQEEHNMSLVFITHDLALAANIADKVLVMYQGNVMEYGEAQQVLRHPQHAYTKALLASRPSPEHKGYQLPAVADFLNNATPPQRRQYAITVSDNILLQVNNINVWFPEEKNLLGNPQKYFKAVNDVSFELKKGETLGLVGESGSGKSTLSRALIGLLPTNGGHMLFNGQDISQLPVKEWRQVRRHMQMIFQDPYASLNPRMTIADTLTEPLRIHNIVPYKELHSEAQRLLNLVQLPSDALHKYPHQFSGGQRQRIGIARALALRPKLIICDESVSALDVSIQAQILNLLKELQEKFDLSYLFISHDLSVVHYISDRIMVMQAGEIVETGPANQVLQHPANNYTKRLVAAMP